jgi:hypothetical protein
MPPAWLETAITASGWPQILAFDRSATGIRTFSPLLPNFSVFSASRRQLQYTETGLEAESFLEANVYSAGHQMRRCLTRP